MRVIIAGSRGFANYEYLLSSMIDIVQYEEDITVISGTARGADQMGERWAKEYGHGLEQYPAEWNRYGRSAGYKRNELMATKADTLVAFWDGKSKGTQHMINLGHKYNLKIHVFTY